MIKAGDQIKSAIASLFKQVPGGNVFRAPNPRIVGRADHYLVNEAQREEITAIMTPRRPMLVLAGWVGGLLLAIAAAVVACLVVAPDYPVTAFVGWSAARVLAAFLALHLSARVKLRRLQPVLARVPRTDEQITIAEIRQALNEAKSYRQLLRVGMSSAFACVASIVGVAILTYFRKQHVSFFSDPMPLLFCFNAIIFGLLSVSQFHDALQKAAGHAERTGPFAGPIFIKLSRHLTSACALSLLAFLATTAWIGVDREFSDQRQGLRYEAKGEHDNAIKSFSRAIAAEPNSYVAYSARAKSYSAKGDHDRAIADYTKAIELDGTDALAYYFRGVSHTANKDDDRAIADFAKAIGINPRNPSFYFLRGLRLAAKKDHDHAAADFSKAIEINPQHANAYFFRARTFEAKGDRDHALADFNKAIEINPKDYYSYFFRGIALGAAGEHDRAIADFTKAIEIEPKNASANRNRASAYNLIGARTLAIADYKEMLEVAAVTDADRQWQEHARKRIDQLTSMPPAPAGSR